MKAALARRIALAAQGFDRPRPRRVTRREIRATVRRLGLLQVDYVNVLVPAQYQPLFSRLGPYDRALLDDLTYCRRVLTEKWAHQASIVPIELWPVARAALGEYDRRWRAIRVFWEEHQAYAEEVLAEIRERGPLAAGDLPVPEAEAGRDGWWWSLRKTALEALFTRGELAATERRPDFSRVFDLAERVIPPEHLVTEGEPAAARRELLLRAARAHGVATAGDLADYFQMPVPEARRLLAELLAAGELLSVTVEGWREPAFLHPQARRPRRIAARALLSPFDPVVWTRPRVARLFGVDYKLEIWVPAEKRRWGYYVLPFLLGDRIVARVDLKADRAAGRLAVPAAYLEAGEDADAVAPELAAELHQMAAWLGLEGVAVEPKGDLAPALARAV